MSNQECVVLGRADLEAKGCSCGEERAPNERVTHGGTFTPLGRPWIVSAACRNSKSGLIVAGARHFDDIMRKTIDAMCGDMTDRTTYWQKYGWSDADQGFIDQYGRFYNRKEALLVAQQNKQCFRNPDAGFELYSEDLY